MGDVPLTKIHGDNHDTKGFLFCFFYLSLNIQYSDVLGTHARRQTYMDSLREPTHAQRQHNHISLSKVSVNINRAQITVSFLSDIKINKTFR